jgi:hypothetical protein
MSDTDITALIERLRDRLTFMNWADAIALMDTAAAALEECQAEIGRLTRKFEDRRNYRAEEADFWKARAEKADPVDDGIGRFTISVEKLLCEKLGKPWRASGISIATLVDELAARAEWAEARLRTLGDKP